MDVDLKLFIYLMTRDSSVCTQSNPQYTSTLLLWFFFFEASHGWSNHPSHNECVFLCPHSDTLIHRLDSRLLRASIFLCILVCYRARWMSQKPAMHVCLFTQCIFSWGLEGQRNTKQLLCNLNNPFYFLWMFYI